MDNKVLRGQVAIITGSGTGIGRGIALEFAKAGASIVLAGRRLPVLEKTAQDIKALGAPVLCVPTDTTQKTSVENLVRSAVNKFGKIDILVNNAAVPDTKSMLIQVEEEEWDRIIDTNLKGYFLCAQAAGKAMVEQKKGTIINIASVTAYTAPVRGGLYNISKAGVVTLTQALARQLAAYRIRVNGVAPGYTYTPMTENVQHNPDLLKKVENFIPLGEMADPVDIANTCLFLASDASRHITGATILNDGGQLLQYKYGVD